MSVQVKKNGIWEAVAGNTTNTSGITESSALSNIGTSANATQHDVNVTIDSKIAEEHQYDDPDYVNIQVLSPASQVINLALIAKRKGDVVTLRWNLATNLTGSSHNTLGLLDTGSVPAKYIPSEEVAVTALGYRNNETTYMIGRFILRSDGSFALGEHYTSGNDQGITQFGFSMTYVV